MLLFKKCFCLKNASSAFLQCFLPQQVLQIVAGGAQNLSPFNHSFTDLLLNATAYSPLA